MFKNFYIRPFSQQFLPIVSKNINHKFSHNLKIHNGRKLSTISQIMSKKAFKLRYISDLHLEFYHIHKLPLPQIEPESTTDCIALCGDIGNPSFPNYKEFLSNMATKFSKVFLISGNHEYYQIFNKNEKLDIDKTDQLINELCSSFNNVYYLNNNSYQLTDKLTIIGTTLWSNIFENHEMISRYMNDYNCIYIGNRLFNINDSTRLNYINSQWIESQISEAQQKGKKLIVLTHHMPSYKMIIPKYTGHFASCCFANHLDKLIRDPIIIWLCGHSHCCVENNINGIYCGINAVGYLKEKTGYELNKYIEVASDE